ncbi:tRNA glutamyl-Q(34) synthetase GluQRS [Erythrobacter sp.]|jgi:glutamyl-Q tRNA(Asp) synthetase|uniref:tRNA glutamyl-Q(34) synthetase GluQRS n=1 Tax=Erythrobacter sp. TaxID=1042 RepID=UPI002EAE34C0|nr:tRNA glutamyl-Q(34) synthetase GluQRS [Erythrobacter sp.]
MKEAPLVTRFAPSPNGRLHLGHAYSAIVAHDLARAAGGEFLLRIEDIDGPRSRNEHADEFRRDLEWLGLEWLEVPAQSTRLAQYRAAADTLRERGLLYPCSLTRREIAALPSRIGEDGVQYPGSARGMSDDCDMSDPNGGAALRLDIDRAMEWVGDIVWSDRVHGNAIADPRMFGDVVLVRKDLPAVYHLAVTLDDARDGVTLVTRGRDLLEATHIHRVLQELLELPVPQWHHHDLILDENGEKLAKSKGSAALAERREAGEDGHLLAEQLRLRAPRSWNLSRAVPFNQA